MLRRPARLVTVLLTTAALTAAAPVVTPVPAAALGSCDFPLPLTFDFVGAGAFAGPNDTDYWSYTAFGTTHVGVVSTSSLTRATVYTASCGTAIPCETPVTPGACTVTYDGPLVVVVRGAGAYVVLVAGEGDPPPGYFCEPIDTGAGCVDVDPGAALVDETVYELVAPVTDTHTVAGWVDAYRFTGPTGGSTTVACVVLAIDAGTTDACAVAGRDTPRARGEPRHATDRRTHRAAGRDAAARTRVRDEDDCHRARSRRRGLPGVLTVLTRARSPRSPG